MPEQLPETRFLDMAAKAADGAGWNECRAVGSTHALQNSIIAHARTLAELAALRPVPEVDEDLRVLRAIMAAGDANKAYQYLDGTRDDYPSMVAGLAVLKSERPRYTPEQATEIAREICARVAESWGRPSNARNYRVGLYDKSAEMTFTKAMLLHETGEGK